MLNRKDKALSDKYLRNEDDGLKTRKSQDYAKDKLTILQRSISMFTTSMRNKEWAAINYLDLLAGPGKNRLGESGEVILGSPLLALETRFPFDNYFFVESGRQEFADLEKRVRSSPLYNCIRMYNEDCNDAIRKIITEIDRIDKNSTRGRKSLNLAFIDPEGLEIHWKTIEILGERTRSDLIINFSTSGITRNIRQLSKLTKETAMDKFFGTREWQQHYENLSRKESTMVRRVLLNLYAERLNNLSYLTTPPGGEHIILNSKNRQLYSLICASKHPLGIQFWKEAIRELNQPKLPGFDEN